LPSCWSFVELGEVGAEVLHQALHCGARLLGSALGCVTGGLHGVSSGLLGIAGGGIDVGFVAARNEAEDENEGEEAEALHG
jgi:hypothetical protein